MSMVLTFTYAASGGVWLVRACLIAEFLNLKFSGVLKSQISNGVLVTFEIFNARSGLGLLLPFKILLKYPWLIPILFAAYVIVVSMIRTLYQFGIMSQVQKYRNGIFFMVFQFGI